MRLPEGADHSVVSVINYLIWGSGLVLSAAAAGLSGTQLTVVFGALGVGIGFGLQSIVNNFVSGLILIFERPIKVGDRVQTASYFGIVTGIGIRASTVRTFDGVEVVVPNGDLVAKEFVNWTRTDRDAKSGGPRPRRARHRSQGSANHPTAGGERAGQDFGKPRAHRLDDGVR